jgi:ribonuclease J
LSHRVPFTIGPFEITPFLNDHSAFDAYSMIVRAGGRSLFYTGDIRGHGRKQGIFEELLRKPPTDIDVLLMEGTNIRPHADVETAPISETQVEDECMATFKATDGLCLVSFSAQNIDRLVTVYRAAKRSGRTTVVDLYAASIARATGNAHIPQPGAEWTDVRVYVPRWQRVKVKEAKDFDRVAQIKPYRIYEEDLAANPSKYVVMSGMASLPQFLRADCLEDSTFVWSLWTGYLKDVSGKKLVDFLAEHNIPMTIHHTSGHASIGDLQRLAKALNPKRVVPIHTFAGERYPEHFDHVEPKDDGAWWDV